MAGRVWCFIEAGNTTNSVSLFYERTLWIVFLAEHDVLLFCKLLYWGFFTQCVICVAYVLWTHVSWYESFPRVISAVIFSIDV